MKTCARCGAEKKTNQGTYCRHCRWLDGRHPRWCGGITIEHGYRMKRMVDHPAARPNGYVPEHRLVMEAILGRPLLRTEFVHHRNGDKQDNRADNLQLMPSMAEHYQHHRRWSDEELLSALRTKAASLGRTPRAREMGNYSTYLGRFGTWNGALRAAGLADRGFQKQSRVKHAS